jgi:PAS domain S-box-containing protein
MRPVAMGEVGNRAVAQKKPVSAAGLDVVSAFGTLPPPRIKPRSPLSVQWAMARPTSPRRGQSTVQRRVIKKLEKALAGFQPHPGGRDTLRARADSVLATLSGVGCAILIANDWGRYVHWNKRAMTLTGYTEAELRRRAVWDLTPAADLGAARRMWRTFLTDGRMEGPFDVRHKDGRAIPVHYVAIANVLPGLHVSALLPTRRRAVALPQSNPRRRRSSG